jgi:hypothetical protein
MTTDEARIKIAGMVRELGFALHALDTMDENHDREAEIAEQSVDFEQALTTVHMTSAELADRASERAITALEKEEA